MTDHVVLVIEDERPLAEAIKKKLELSGFTVVTARTVEQAMHYLEEVEGISVIWLDHYLMGTEDGLALVAKVKAADSVWKHLPIFVVSNTASPDKVQTYLRLGVNRYYVKAEHRLDEIIADITHCLTSGNCDSEL